jgi:D-alanyl-lipoteichoic acid acyltransferase DltB (MBOAT superfamily)
LRRTEIVRGILATLLSPIAAAFFVAVPLTIIASAVELSRGRLDVAVQVVPGVLLITFFGIAYAGLFSVLFAVVTQVPLAWIYSRIRPLRALVHVGVSALLGALFFPIAFPFVDRIQGGIWNEIHFAYGPDLAFAIGIGLIGGAAVGLIWYQLLLRPLFELPTGSAAA